MANLLASSPTSDGLAAARCALTFWGPVVKSLSLLPLLGYSLVVPAFCDVLLKFIEQHRVDLLVAHRVRRAL